MPIRYTPLITDHFYHIYNRGVNKRRIFINKRDYTRAVNLLRFYNYVDHPIRFSKFLLLSTDQRKEIWNRLKTTQTNNDIISFCLMPNHFHLLAKQNVDRGISKFLANFQNSYAKYFNIKYERVGSLFQGPFKVKLIDAEDQLLHISRYIHLNPFSSAIVKNYKDLLSYPWSSFGEYDNNDNFSLCKKDVITNCFRKPIEYKDFVLNNAEYQKTLESIKHLVLE